MRERSRKPKSQMSENRAKPDRGGTMLQIKGLDEGYEIFKTLGSEVRMQIVQLLAENGAMNMNVLAGRLGLTNGAITVHVRKLEENGIIDVKTDHNSRGAQKICSLLIDEILLDLYPGQETRSFMAYETSVRVGHYSDYSVRPGCGLAGPTGLIGAEDDPHCFSYPEHLQAEMLWLHEGFVEYRIPNLLPSDHVMMQMTVSFEISSADYGLPEDSMSEITFYLNGRKLGEWLSFRTANSSRGIYTPFWWKGRERQHGYLKMLVVNTRGVFLDGVKVSEPEADWNSEEMKLRFEAVSRNSHAGGLALYGSGFGDYKQDIQIKVHYTPLSQINEFIANTK
ncbi:MAG: winged helix-turn-helix transcriptional regulator [Blautia sp.]|nr:winged helix-turn-helix transcriptional regulator [Blautia sp.]